MIRTSKHILQYQTSKKNNLLDELFMVYERDLNLCIDEIINNECAIPKFGSFDSGIIQRAVYRQIVYKHASEIIRSQLKRATEKRYRAYKKLYTKCIRNRNPYRIYLETF